MPRRYPFIGGPLDGAVKKYEDPPVFSIFPDVTEPERFCVVYQLENTSKGARFVYKGQRRAGWEPPPMLQ